VLITSAVDPFTLVEATDYEFQRAVKHDKVIRGPPRNFTECQSLAMQDYLATATTHKVAQRKSAIRSFASRLNFVALNLEESRSHSDAELSCHRHSA